jgi:hypothetical protein
MAVEDPNALISPMSLMQMNFRLAQPEYVIDLNRV